MESAIAAAIRSDTKHLVAITWDSISKATQEDLKLPTVIDAIHNGFPDCYRTNPATSMYWQYRNSLHVTDGVIIYNDRVVVPPFLRPDVLEALHAAHQGASTMGLRARSIVFWPGMTADIENRRRSCLNCNKNAPSHPPLPASLSTPPTTPFEQTFADYFDCAGQHYLIVGDRLSGWCDVFQSPKGTPQAGSEGLVTCLRNYFSRFGVPEEIASDGGPEFISSLTKNFLDRWGVRHRLSSAYNPKSNGRAEVAVKTAKRLLRSNTGPSGNLDTDRFLRAMMQLRNTPDPDCNISPAEIVFGRPLRDTFAFVNRLEKFNNDNIRPLWRNAWNQKEEALRQRFHHSAEGQNQKARSLLPLKLGDRCYVQNQTGNNQRRWDRSGTVMEIHGFDAYTVKIDGTGRLTRRNRRYLRKFEPASLEIRTVRPQPKVTLDTVHHTSMERPSAPPPSTNNDHHGVILDIADGSAVRHDTVSRNRTASLPVESASPNGTASRTETPSRNDTASRNETDTTRRDAIIDKAPTVVHTMPTSSASDSAPEATPVTTPSSTRPVRSRKAPSRYVPETGKWD